MMSFNRCILLLFLAGLAMSSHEHERNNLHHRHSKHDRSDTPAHLMEDVGEKLDEAEIVEIDSDGDLPVEDVEDEDDDNDADEEDEDDQIEEKESSIIANPCAKVKCKAGKECSLDNENKPKCVCIQECPSDITIEDAVCGNDNKTYESECVLWQTKCLGGLSKKEKKKLKRLKLNYLGPCKKFTSCKKSELIQYPARMRSWLKNIFLQMYDTPLSEGGLNDKQRYHGRKLYAERVKLQDFEEGSPELMKREFAKFYPLYRYPIHWKFAELDIKSENKHLNKRELEPLRAPLIPLEHCTKAFFKRADKDKDKMISLVEWGKALGLEEDDIDQRLVF